MMVDQKEIKELRQLELSAANKVASIQRKLAGGSKAVTFELLASHQADLAQVQKQIMELGELPIGTTTG